MVSSCASDEISDDFELDIDGITEGELLLEIEEEFELSPTKGTKSQREISDDDVSSHGDVRQPKSGRGTKTPIHTLEDFVHTIDTALQEQRIDEKKAERLRELLRSDGDWIEKAYSLLCEQIPMKRKGNGYSCRVCQVPKKGHTCMYCHVCTTPEKKLKKDDEHVCTNCPMCFEEGKKNKKLVQVVCGGRGCPHGSHESKNGIGV